jgi:hypothetical protein
MSTFQNPKQRHPGLFMLTAMLINVFIDYSRARCTRQKYGKVVEKGTVQSRTMNRQEQWCEMM